MIRKDLAVILDLIKNNQIVKIVAPSASGKTTILPKELGKKYKVTVVVGKATTAKSLNSSHYPNINYISPEQYWSSKPNSDILIIDSDSLENFLIVSNWKNKLILLSLLPHSYFPNHPTFTVKPYCEKTIEIRYLRDFENSHIVELIYELDNSTIEGNFLVFTLDKDRIIQELNSIPSKRKIVVVDDSATYLRDTNFGCIIDNMRERRIETTLTGGIRNRVRYVSKQEAELRAQRSSKSVIVYRMISFETYSNLPEIIPGRLFRLPLHILMLDLYERKLNPMEILFNFDEREVKKMYGLFLNFGLLDLSMKLTEKARTIQKLDFGIKPAIIATEGGYGGLVLAALIDNFEGTPFLFDSGVDKNKGVFEYQIESDNHINKYYNRFRGQSDLETFLYLYIDFESSEKSLSDWCNNNSILYSYMDNVLKSIEGANKILNFPKIEISEKILGTDIIAKLYSERLLTLDTERTILTQYYDEKGTLYDIDSLSINSISSDRPLEVYSLITSSIPNESHNIVSLSYASPFVSYQEFQDKPITY